MESNGGVRSGTYSIYCKSLKSDDIFLALGMLDDGFFSETAWQTVTAFTTIQPLYNHNTTTV